MLDRIAILALRVCAWATVVLGLLGTAVTAGRQARLLPFDSMIGEVAVFVLGFLLVWAFLLVIASIAESLLEVKEQGRLE